VLHVRLHLGVIEFPSDQSLGIENGVVTMTTNVSELLGSRCG
jgi:hypothetical protein